MKYYLIAYDNLQLFSPSAIHNAITSISGVTDWWHYLPSVYIVCTTRSANYLADTLIPQFKGLRFFVVKIDLDDYSGVLNKKAWEWIKRKKNQEIEYKVAAKATQSPLVDLLSSVESPPPPKSLTDILSPRVKPKLPDKPPPLPGPLAGFLKPKRDKK